VEQSNIKTFMDVKEVSEYLKISVRTIRDLVAHREIPYSRVASRIRFDRDEINRWFKQNSVKPRVS